MQISWHAWMRQQTVSLIYARYAGRCCSVFDEATIPGWCRRESMHHTLVQRWSLTTVCVLLWVARRLRHIRCQCSTAC
jgi:hypothetical protein